MKTENWTPYDWLEFVIRAAAAFVILGGFLAVVTYIGWVGLTKDIRKLEALPKIPVIEPELGRPASEYLWAVSKDGRKVIVPNCDMLAEPAKEALVYGWRLCVSKESTTIREGK